ncbi:hypothetical protein RMSM_04541 [Rhodopirellula maiorica SM1]|uniref:Uncharacterized protein n=1 Tax=Rhodopirellula maiorica SM1 TaxID=1265738 RepID=M5RT18_9BACT|nr:hypothetical protein RMSM_04541 [Rhodopirellula maiorica SM1]
MADNNQLPPTPVDNESALAVWVSGWCPGEQSRDAESIEWGR